jgi:hypothetical protein
MSTKKQSTDFVNHCKRCGRPLKDPSANYGWWCAQIIGSTEDSNHNSPHVLTQAIIQLAYLKYTKEMQKGNREIFYSQTIKNLLLDSFVKQELAKHEHQDTIIDEAQKDIDKILKLADENPGINLSYKYKEENEFDYFRAQNLSKMLENSPDIVYTNHDNNTLYWQTDVFYEKAREDVRIFLDSLIEHDGAYQRYSFLEETAKDSDFLSSQAYFFEEEPLIDTAKLMATAVDVYADVSTLGASTEAKLLLSAAVAPLYSQDTAPTPGLRYVVDSAVDSIIDYSDTKSFEKMAEYIAILDSKYRYLMDPKRVTNDTSRKFISDCAEKIQQCKNEIKNETDPGKTQYLEHTINLLEEIVDLNENPEHSAQEFKKQTKALIEQTRRQIQTPEGRKHLMDSFNHERWKPKS